MKTIKTPAGYEVMDVANYVESETAEPTSRLLEGSSDHNYAAEYMGSGSVCGIPVIAVYLFADGDMSHEDTGQWDWDKALDNGRVIIDVDALTEDQYANLNL